MSAATETLLFLANYNSWRRGDKTIEMPSPAKIGATIDDAVIQNANAHHAERKDAIARAESAEREAFDWKKIARYEAARAERAEREVAGLKANNRFQRGHSAGYAEAKADCATELAALAAERDQLRAQLHALNLVCGTTDADKFQTWVDRANARAERAEAELAAERARLDWLQAQEVKRGLEITEGHDDPLPFLVLDEDGTTHWGDTYRAAIDAAMKEGAK